MDRPKYEIYVRDRNLQRIGVISQFSNLELTMNYNDVGGWIIDMPDTKDSGADFLKTVRAQGGGLGGIVVQRNGVPIFSGPIHGLEATANYQGDQTSENISFWGSDDNGLLFSRLAMPPTPLGTYQAWAGTGIDYDEYINVPAETCLVELVENNCINSPPRKINGLVTTSDQGRGNVITLRARYQNLIEKLQEAATAGRLGFRTIQKTPGQIVFEVYEPANKTDTVIFSREFGNLTSYRYKVEKPEANFVIVGGGGEDVARNFRYAGDEPSRSLYGTWEIFVDQRQTTDVAELNQALYKTLQEKTEKIEVEIQPHGNSPVRYPDHYDLGDTATVVIGGERTSDIIRSIKITLTPDKGEVITPTIGTPGVGTTFRLYDNYRNLEARLINLETI